MRLQFIFVFGLNLLAHVASRVLEFSYVGCYVDNSTRVLDGLKHVSSIGGYPLAVLYGVRISNMSYEFCSGICALGGFPFFGVKAGSECFCGRAYATIGRASDTDCSSTCSGNSAQKCGGSWRISVFAQSYSDKKVFMKSDWPTLTVSTSQAAHWTLAARTDVECLAHCEAGPDCQAAIFSGEQRLCHLLRFAHPPASLSGIAGDFFVPG